jgi:carboxyl-terminal processing protease
MSTNKSILKNPFLILFIFTLGMYLGKYLSSSSEYIQLNSSSSEFPKLVELLSFLEYNYVDKLDLDSLQEDIITNTLESLDPHSTYIHVDDLQGITEGMQGNFEGIGVEFQIQHDTIVVVSPISGGPSERAGIRSGDRIVKVDTLNVAGVGFTNSDVVKNLRGDKGTEVKLFIKRPKHSKLIEFNIIRDKIPITSVDVSYMLDAEIGYIKVNRFSGTTDAEFTNALDNLKAEGMKKLVLDLRSNPGGYLHAATAMVNEFLSNGEIVYTQGNSRSKKVYKANRYGGFLQKDLVVLVDEGSASASEIVAGALQDHDRAAIIGRRTFGKGLVQEQTQMSDGSAFRLTTARYYTPSGRSIQKSYSKDVEAYHLESLKRYENGELYSQDSIKVTDSLKYFTDKGRVVYGGGGIAPDYFVPLDTTGRSDWLFKVLAANIISGFVFDYVDRHTEFLNSFSTPENFAANFTISEDLFKSFIQLSEENDIPLNKAEISRSKAWVIKRLTTSIARQKWNDLGFFTVLNHTDPSVKKGMEILGKD